MSNYWAIAIGINQYQHFKPLLYAQWDAQALWTYWIREGGIPQAQCMLLTDSGPVARMVSHQTSPTLPNKKNIQQQLVELGHHQFGQGDTLWCFFSGYGMHHNGKDYLIPVDGNPNDLAQTGISADSLFSTLQSFPTDRIVVLLDLKRTPESIGPNAQAPNHRLGDDIAQHAKQSGIATILASQPDQLSHETLTLRQGLFTSTLLESLRTHGCFQLGQLTQYLEHRLPELSEYHWRPRQEPLAIVPTAQRRQVFLAPVTRQPAMANVRSGKSTTIAGLNPLLETDKIETDKIETDIISRDINREINREINSETGSNGDVPQTVRDPLTVIQSKGEQSPPFPVTPPPPPPPFSPIPPSAKEGQAHSPVLPFPSASSSQRSTVQLPALGQELSYTPEPRTTSVKTILPPVLKTPDPTPDPIPALSNDEPPEPIPVVETPEDEVDGYFLSKGLKYSLPLFTALMMLGVLWLNWPAFRQTQAGSIEDVSPTSPDGEFKNNAGATPNGISGEIPAKRRQANAPSQTSSPVSSENGEGTSMAPGAGDLEQSDQTSQNILNRAIATLNEAREETPVSQASDFGRAIAIANQIKPEEPLYDEAQTYISRWGEVILDLAKSRAQSGEYEKAIATVNLIEADLPLLYPKAQRLLANWQQTVGIDNSSRSIIDAAKADIIKFPDQAFPYNRGIGKLREIEPDDPLHEEAQSLIDEWSQQILAIATNRARQSDIQHAIDTAQYVPQDTAAYPDALKAIEQWSQ